MIFPRKIEHNRDVDHKWPQILSAIIASTCAIINGVLFAWTSPSIPILISNSSHIEPLTIEDCSYFTTLPPIGIIISTPFFGLLGKIISNKLMIILISVPQTLSWVLIIVARSRWEFFVSRFIMGISESLLFFCIPAYIGEICTPEVRGTWGCIMTLSSLFGILIINIVGSYFKIVTTAYIFVAMPTIFAILVSFLPESPYHYLKRNEPDKAKRSLQLLRWRNNVEEEFNALTNNIHQQTVHFKDLFLIRKNRLGLFIGIGNRFFQQLSGYPAIIFYNQYIFKEAGTNLSPAECAMIYCALQVSLVAVFSYFSDAMGRRSALIYSSIGCGLCLTIEGVYFFIYQQLQLDVSNFKWVPLCGLILYVITFTFGLNIVPTLMMSEIIDSHMKNHSLSVMNITFALAMLLCSKLFHVLSSSIGMFAPFWFYAACCFVAVFYFYFCVPETRGKTLYEIQEFFKRQN